MEQLPLWKIERRFVRLLFSIVDKQQIAGMGVNAFACLVVIRRFVPMDGGSAFPSAAKISRFTSLSPTTVYKAIHKLEELGWLVKRKDGRKNKYQLNEHLFAQSTNEKKRPNKMLKMPFGVADWKRAQADLEEFEYTGELPAYSPIKIQNATFHITINNYQDGSKHLEVKVDEKVLEDIAHPFFRERMRKRLEDEGERIAEDVAANTLDVTKS